MTIKLSLKGGGGLPKLAPDLTSPSTLLSNTGYVSITGIDATGSLTTLLSLTGKFSIDFLQLSGVTAESNTIKLTIDGVVIWNDTYTFQTQVFLVGAAGISRGIANSIQCESSFLLELQTATDTSIDFNYSVRPIL